MQTILFHLSILSLCGLTALSLNGMQLTQQEKVINIKKQIQQLAPDLMEATLKTPDRWSFEKYVDKLLTTDHPDQNLWPAMIVIMLRVLSPERLADRDKLDAIGSVLIDKSDELSSLTIHTLFNNFPESLKSYFSCCSLLAAFYDLLAEYIVSHNQVLVNESKEKEKAVTAKTSKNSDSQDAAVNHAPETKNAAPKSNSQLTTEEIKLLELTTGIRKPVVQKRSTQINRQRALLALSHSSYIKGLFEEAQKSDINKSTEIFNTLKRRIALLMGPLFPASGPHSLKELESLWEKYITDPSKQTERAILSGEGEEYGERISRISKLLVQTEALLVLITKADDTQKEAAQEVYSALFKALKHKIETEIKVPFKLNASLQDLATAWKQHLTGIRDSSAFAVNSTPAASVSFIRVDTEFLQRANHTVKVEVERRTVEARIKAEEETRQAQEAAMVRKAEEKRKSGKMHATSVARLQAIRSNKALARQAAEDSKDDVEDKSEANIKAKQDPKAKVEVQAEVPTLVRRESVLKRAADIQAQEGAKKEQKPKELAERNRLVRSESVVLKRAASIQARDAVKEEQKVNPVLVTRESVLKQAAGMDAQENAEKQRKASEDAIRSARQKPLLKRAESIKRI